MTLFSHFCCPFHGRSQDFSKGGSHWLIQRVLIRLSPEYCKLFAYKKAYKGGVTGTPGPPPWLRLCIHQLLRRIDCRLHQLWSCCYFLAWLCFFKSLFHHDQMSLSCVFSDPCYQQFPRQTQSFHLYMTAHPVWISPMTGVSWTSCSLRPRSSRVVKLLRVF